MKCKMGTKSGRETQRKGNRCLHIKERERNENRKDY